MEFLLEVLFAGLPLEKLVHFSIARQVLLNLFEFLVFMVNLGIDINSARNVKFNTEHDSLLVNNPEPHNSNFRSLFYLDDMPVGVQDSVVHVTHEVG